MGQRWAAGSRLRHRKTRPTQCPSCGLPGWWGPRNCHCWGLVCWEARGAGDPGCRTRLSDLPRLWEFGCLKLSAVDSVQLQDRQSWNVKPGWPKGLRVKFKMSPQTPRNNTLAFGHPYGCKAKSLASGTRSWFLLLLPNLGSWPAAASLTCSESQVELGYLEDKVKTE